MADRLRELVEAIAFDPWIETRMQKVATDLLRKWAKEDAKTTEDKGKST